MLNAIFFNMCDVNALKGFKIKTKNPNNAKNPWNQNPNLIRIKFH